MPLLPRQHEMAQLVNDQGEANVEALAQRFEVSAMTVRRDLQVLARAGKVIRTHGGAAPAQRVMFEFEFLQRSRHNQAQKQAIARAAAELVQDGQTLMLDSGSTTLRLAELLRPRQGLTVITTSLPIASELQFCEQIQVLLLGGYLRHGSPDLEGALTEANLETLRADLAIIGADGVDGRGQVYNRSLGAARMLAKMAAAAQRRYVVADSSKIGHPALARFGDLRQWDGLITDHGLGRSVAASLRRAGVNLILAPGPLKGKGES